MALPLLLTGSLYVDAFVERCDVMRRPGRRRVAEPGLHGLLPSADDPRSRLLVTDDRAYGVLTALLPDAEPGVISVFAAATRCAELLDRRPAWQSKTLTAMVCRDLRTVPGLGLSGGLMIRPVRRLAHDAPGGVPLRDAVALAMLADPSIGGPPEVFADALVSMPPAVRLVAAVDGDGEVRATAGAGTFGSSATVIFVNTHPAWRGHGIGTAMTAAALHAAERSGATQACLDASDAGLSIYLRLGFEAVTQTTQYYCAPYATLGR